MRECAPYNSGSNTLTHCLLRHRHTTVSDNTPKPSHPTSTGYSVPRRMCAGSSHSHRGCGRTPDRVAPCATCPESRGCDTHRRSCASRYLSWGLSWNEFSGDRSKRRIRSHLVVRAVRQRSGAGLCPVACIRLFCVLFLSGLLMVIFHPVETGVPLLA